MTNTTTREQDIAGDAAAIASELCLAADTLAGVSATALLDADYANRRLREAEALHARGGFARYYPGLGVVRGSEGEIAREAFGAWLRERNLAAATGSPPPPIAVELPAGENERLLLRADLDATLAWHRAMMRSEDPDFAANAALNAIWAACALAAVARTEAQRIGDA